LQRAKPRLQTVFHHKVNIIGKIHGPNLSGIVFLENMEAPLSQLKNPNALVVFWHKLLLTHANRIIRKFYGVKKMMKKGLVLIVLAFRDCLRAICGSRPKSYPADPGRAPTTPPTEMPTKCPRHPHRPTIAPPAAPTIPQVETSVP
jgi:hypothetical protein